MCSKSAGPGDSESDHYWPGSDLQVEPLNCIKILPFSTQSPQAVKLLQVQVTSYSLPRKTYFNNAFYVHRSHYGRCPCHDGCRCTRHWHWPRQSRPHRPKWYGIFQLTSRILLTIVDLVIQLRLIPTVITVNSIRLMILTAGPRRGHLGTPSISYIVSFCVLLMFHFKGWLF